MAKITKEYANPNNGGRERITRDGDRYYINSYIGGDTGWCGQHEVTRERATIALAYTKAPSDVIEAILGEVA